MYIVFCGWIRVKSRRCAFGVTSSLCLLNATIKHHLNQFSDSTIVDELGQNLYVDDWLSGSDSEEEAVSMFLQAQSIMKKGGMSLAK